MSAYRYPNCMEILHIENKDCMFTTKVNTSQQLPIALILNYS